MMNTMTRQDYPDYVSSAVYNAVNDQDVSGLVQDEDYTDYGLHKYHVDILYKTNTAKDLIELELELNQEFGEAFDDQCDYSVDKWGDNITVHFQTITWYWYSAEWQGPISDYIADIIGCDPIYIDNVTETF